MICAIFMLKLGHSEKATKSSNVFHLKFDVTQWWRQILSGRFFQFCVLLRMSYLYNETLKKYLSKMNGG